VCVCVCVSTLIYTFVVIQYQVKRRIAFQWNLFKHDERNTNAKKRERKSQQKSSTFGEGKQLSLSSELWSNHIFALLNNYYDVLFCRRTMTNQSELRQVYVLHILNHVFKTRDYILRHNGKISKSDPLSNLEFRDQGFTRPKVLVLVPFRSSCFKITNLIIKLSPKVQGSRVANKKKFYDEFGGKTYVPGIPKPGSFNSLSMWGSIE